MTGPAAGPPALPVGLIVLVAPIRDDATILLVECPYCGEVEPHRIRLNGSDGPVRDAFCRRGQYLLKVHPELAAGHRWEPGDEDAYDEDERQPRWV